MPEMSSSCCAVMRGSCDVVPCGGGDDRAYGLWNSVENAGGTYPDAERSSPEASPERELRSMMVRRSYNRWIGVYGTSGSCSIDATVCSALAFVLDVSGRGRARYGGRDGVMPIG